MHESSTYQLILDEGRVEGDHRLLLRMARVQFGEPDPAMVAALSSITDVDRLEALGERLLSVKTWQEWLAMP